MNRKWLVGGCAGAVALTCIGSGAVLVIASRAVNAVDGASAACDGRPVPDAAEYTPGGAQRVVAFERLGSGGWSYSSMLPFNFPDAEDVSEATLVFCFEDESSRIVESCAYEGGSVVHRTGRSRPVRVVVAQTGEVIRDTTVEGAESAECPDSISTGGGGSIGVRVLGIPVASVGGEAPDREERTHEGPSVARTDVEDAFRDLVL